MRIPPRPPPVPNAALGGASAGVSHSARRYEPPPMVSMSATAQAVQAARAELSRPAVRPEVVAAMRAELAAGTLGGAADLDATVDALLLEFS